MQDFHVSLCIEIATKNERERERERERSTVKQEEDYDTLQQLHYHKGTKRNGRVIMQALTTSLQRGFYYKGYFKATEKRCSNHSKEVVTMLSDGVKLLLI